MRRLLLIAVCFGLTYAWAQEPEPSEEHSVDGAPNPRVTKAGFPGLRLMPGSPALPFNLPKTETPPMHWHGYQDAPDFMPAGYAVDAPPDILKGLRWIEHPEGGFVAAVELRSEGAKALRVRFKGDMGRNGEAVRVYDPVGGYSFGPYTLPIMNEDQTWWTTIIFGDQIGLEFYLPPGATPAGLPPIDGINYFFAGPDWDKAFEDAGIQGCTHRDVACEASWRDTEARAVCMLATLSGNNVSGFCSGGTLNRNPSDLAPIVMTANHCVGTTASANNTTFVWNFQNTTCNGTPPAANSCPRSVGSLLLKRHSGSDWNLLGSYEQVAASWYMGWTSSGSWSGGSSAFGIHHPGGTFKRFSSGSLLQADNDRCFCPAGVTTCDTNQGCFLADVWSVSYNVGFTAPGSSGSPLMDGNRQVRGTLTGGPNDCATSRYGRLSEAYVNVQYYLFDMANPTYVVQGAGTDGGNNNGSSERGTSSNPFSSVYESTFCVPGGGFVNITPANYNERFTLWRPMTLRRQGSSGIVRIGSN